MRVVLAVSIRRMMIGLGGSDSGDDDSYRDGKLLVVPLDTPAKADHFFGVFGHVVGSTERAWRVGIGPGCSFHGHDRVAFGVSSKVVRNLGVGLEIGEPASVGAAVDD